MSGFVEKSRKWRRQQAGVVLDAIWCCLPIIVGFVLHRKHEARDTVDSGC